MNERNNLRIIVIDDNPAIHQDFIKILKTNKIDNTRLVGLEQEIFGDISKEESLPQFEIDTASQGQEGVERIKIAVDKNNPYSLAFVDIRMPPGWDGIETIKHIWEIDKNIQVVICTAHSDYTWEETIEQLGQTDNLLILKKPFDNIAVKQLACALTKKWQLVQDAKDYTSNLEGRVKERTKTLNKSLSVMRATLESSADGILVIDNNGRISDYNNKFLKMWNISEAVIDTNDFQVIIDFISDELESANEFLYCIDTLQDKNEIMIGNLKCKGNRIFEYYTQPYEVDKHPIGRVWSFRNVTQRVSLEQELQFQANHDVLTGLPNRSSLLKWIKQSIAESKSKKTKFAVLFLDLDRFKLINDSLNHEAGDKVLCVVAKRLRNVIRKKDILVRLGGDEFVVIINNIKDSQNIDKIADKLLSTFKEPFFIDKHEIRLSTSIGVSVYPSDGKNIDTLLRNADSAMYRAKELGTNQFHYYTSELNNKNIEKLEKEAELRQALARDEFYLYYQPEFDLKTEKLVSVEALIRWNHPAKGTLLPIDFIVFAEETGLILPISEWVLRSACKQNKFWQDQGLPPIRVAVNISTRQLRLYNLVQLVSKILEETGLDSKYLELELSENLILNNVDIVGTIQELKKLGVQIALDDFGTGFSSLNYLRSIPVDRLKIDQSYVQNFDSRRDDDVIIQAIITMAKNLNLEVLAEGVETKKQLDFLKNQKCGSVQGFYFSKPLSANECEKLLRDPKARLTDS